MSPTKHLNLRTRPNFIDLPKPPHPYYTCGDVIRGTVRVHPTTRPKAVRVLLKGRCKVEITIQRSNNSTTYKEKPEFFSHQLVLFNSSERGASYEIVNMGIEEDGRVALPFEFTFPSVVEKEAKIFTKHSGFEHEPGHPLPPTLSYVGNSSLFSTDENKVEYWIEAAIFNSSVSIPDEVILQHLPFRPLAPPADLSQSVETSKWIRSLVYICSHKIHPDYDPDEKLMKRIKQSITRDRSSTPSSRWDLKAHVPYTLVVGTVLPVTLSLKHIEHTPDLPEAPPLFARRVRVRVTSLLYIRVPKAGFFSDRDLEEIHTEKINIIDRSFVSNNVMLYDGMQFEELGNMKVLGSVLPNFKSYAMRLEHTIQVKIDGACGGETFTVVACQGKCEVVHDLSIAPPPEEHLAVEDISESKSDAGSMKKVATGPPTPPNGESSQDVPPPAYEPPPYQAGPSNAA